jgi:WD40 repeat protein
MSIASGTSRARRGALHDIITKRTEVMPNSQEVFISYSIQDKSIAQTICTVLEEVGISCWIAPRDIPAGAEFEVAILDAIDLSQAIVVILSSSANASPYVMIEVNRAFTKRKAIFTFRVEDIVPAKALEFYLSRHQWTDGFPPPVEERVARIARALNELLGRGQSTAAVATRNPESPLSAYTRGTLNDKPTNIALGNLDSHPVIKSRLFLPGSLGDPVEELVFSVDGKMLFAFYPDGARNLMHWDLGQGELRGAWAAPGGLTGMALSPTGDRIAIVGGTEGSGEKEMHVVHILRVNSGGIYPEHKLKWRSSRNKESSGTYYGSGVGFLWGRDDVVVVGTNDHRGRVWVGQKILHDFEGLGVTVSADGRRFVAEAAEKTYRLWNAEPNCPFEFRDMKVSGRGATGEDRFGPNNLLCLAVWDCFEVWDISSDPPHLVTLLPAPGHYATNSAFRPDGLRLAVTGTGGGVVLHDTSSWECVELSHKHQGDFVKIAFARDGKWLVTALGRKLCVYDSDSSQLLGVVEPKMEITACAVSADSRTVALGDADGKTSLWDLSRE